MFKTTDIPKGLTPLKDINDVTPLNINDKPLIDELAHVLRKYKAEDRFGITLLHNHFEMSESEILLEETNTTTRTQVIRPVSKLSLDETDSIQTSWRLDYGTAIQICVCQRDKNGYHSSHVKL